MKFLNRKRRAILGAGALAVAGLSVVGLSVGTARWAKGSDHAGTVETVNRAGADLTDLHIFPGVNTKNVVLAMSVHPLIAAGQATPDKVSFDPNVLYQFKIDTTGDNVEDLVIQATFSGTGASQKVLIAGPVKPSRTGTLSVFEKPYATTGVIGTTFSPTPGMNVFAGAREDPFFFDLAQFGNIFPDRLVPPGLKTPPAAGQENTPMAAGWRPKGTAQDFLKDFNVLALVVELPRTKLGGGKIAVWETTSVAG